jgi:hypothetical protein
LAERHGDGTAKEGQCQTATSNSINLVEDWANPVVTAKIQRIMQNEKLIGNTVVGMTITYTYCRTLISKYPTLFC